MLPSFLIFKFSFFAFKKLFLRYFLLLLTFVILFAAFGPIFKVKTTTNRQIMQLQKTSGTFDYKIKLPDQQFFNQTQSITDPTLSINTVLQKIQTMPYWVERPFDFLWTPSFKRFANLFESAEQRRYLMFRVETEDVLQNYQQKINQVSLTQGRLPKTTTMDGNNLEVVVSEKYFKLNQLKLGDKIKVFDFDLTIVGVGNSISNVFLDFTELLKIKRGLNLKNTELQKIDIFKLVNVVFINRSLFNYLLVQKAIINYRNDVYLKFGFVHDKSDINQFVDDFNVQINKLVPGPEIRVEQVIPFNSDSPSGLQTSYSGIEFSLFIMIFLAGIGFLIAFIYLITSFVVKKNTTNFARLISLGFSLRQIIFNFFFYHFFFLSLSAILAFLVGLIIDYRLVILNNTNGFLTSNFEPFIGMWFGIFVVGLPILIASLFFLFGFLKLRNFRKFLFPTHYENQMFTLNTFFYRKIKQWFPIVSPRWKIFNFFFFRNIGKKLLIFFLLICLFLLFFLFLFFQTSQDYYLSNQWAFLNRDVENITFYKFSTYFDNSTSRKIVSNLEFVSNENFSKKMTPITDFNNLNLNRPTCLLDTDNQRDLEELVKNGLFTKRCFQDYYIDKTLTTDPIVKDYLNNFNFDKVFFNKVIYDPVNELPILFTEGLINETSVSNYFLTADYQDFFNFSGLSEQIADFQIAENGSFGMDDYGIPYVVAAAVFKKLGYNLGDELPLDVIINGHKNLAPIKVRIGAFLNAKYAQSKTLFLNYDVLTNRNFDSPPLVDELLNSDGNMITRFKPYNFLLRKTAAAAAARNLVIDLDLSKDIFNFDTEKFNFENLYLANTESPYVFELIFLSKNYFNVFRVYLLMIFILGIIFTFFSLLLAITFLIQHDYDIIAKFNVLGFRLKELFSSYIGVFMIFLILGITLSFLLALGLFTFFDVYFQAYEVFLYIHDIWLHLLWTFLPFILVLLSYSFYQYRFLTKGRI